MSLAKSVRIERRFARSVRVSVDQNERAALDGYIMQPSVSKALTAMAERENVPVAGKDGKTGQTFIKTVLAPAFRSRSLYVEGWFSTNIVGLTVLARAATR